MRATESTARALLVDDDPVFRETLRAVLEEHGVEVEEAEDGRAALARLEHAPAHLVITDLQMPGMNGLELLAHLQKMPERPRTIVVTGLQSSDRALEAMRGGAYDCLRKPCEPEQLVAVVRRAVESATLARQNRELASAVAFGQTLVYRSEAMGRVVSLLQRAAPSDATVLLTGESGTGKESVAECIVRASRRAARPFLRWSGASLAPDLAAAALFGHARGAFTGAHRAQPGILREANGGTLLLDEVGELAPEVQAGLLRVLQEGEVRPVGSSRTVAVDVRMIAATQHDLEELVRAGRFREDLYYRLRVVEIRIPPLRERAEDIAPLVEHFLARFCARIGARRPEVPADLLRALARRPWPGNVRQLKNAVETLVTLSPPGRLDASVLSEARTTRASATLSQKTAAYERGLILEALELTRGNRSEAARLLGVGRATLHEKLRKHGLGGGPA